MTPLRTFITHYEQDPVRFLVEAKFPRLKLFEALAKKAPTKPEPKQLGEAAAYAAELRHKPSAQLQELVDQEHARRNRLAVERRDAEERARFFNLPSARANTVHWAKASYWTLEEAVALSFGRAPEVVSWDKLQTHAAWSAFALEYGLARDLAMRARHVGQLYDQVLPGFFIAWAERTGLNFSPEVKSAVISRGGQVADWKTAYDEAKEQLVSVGKQLAESTEALRTGNRLLEEQRAIIESRDGRIEELLRDSNSRDSSPPEKINLEEPSLGARERESLLKLVISMAIEGYRYDPKLKRNTAVTDIAVDVEKVGLKLDPDTVRKWLREAADLLPSDG